MLATDLLLELLEDKEVQRIAAAFRVNGLCVENSFSRPEPAWNFGGTCDDVLVFWEVNAQTRQVLSFKVSQGATGCLVSPRRQGWFCLPHPTLSPYMARGLYCLGIEDEALFAELNHSLSAHEQMELRLSLAREFWPQKWEDELHAG